MGGQLATGSSIYMASAGVPAADGAGLSSIKSFSQLLTSIAALPLAGGTMTGNVLFTDNTYDIGASGATRPRTVYAATSIQTPLTLTDTLCSTALNHSSRYVNLSSSAMSPGTINITLGASAAPWGSLYAAGGTLTGNLLFTDNTYTIGASLATRPSAVHVGTGGVQSAGDVAMRKTTQGYMRAYSPDGIKQSYFYTTNTGLSTFVSVNGQMWFEANGSDYAMLSDGSSNGYFRVFSTSSRAVFVTHNNTDADIGSSYGKLKLSPNTTLQVTKATAFDSTVNLATYTVATLPAAASNAYANANVSDSNVAASGNYGATVAGGGANKVRVFSDGTNWVIA